MKTYISFTKEYNGTLIYFSTDSNELNKIKEKGKPCVLLLTNENMNCDIGLFSFALYILDEKSNILSLDEIISIADDEYCRIIIARFQNKPLDICEDDYLVIREFSTGDSVALKKLFDKGESCPEFMGAFFEDEKDACEVIHNYIERTYKFYNFGIWGIYSKINDELIGAAGFTPRQSEDGLGLELGYIVKDDYRNQGIGTRAVSHCMNYAVNNIECNHIFATVNKTNIPSVKMLERIKAKYKSFEIRVE